MSPSPGRGLAAPLEVSEADDGFPWDDYVNDAPTGCFFHLEGLLDALKRLTGSALHRLVFRKGNEVVAVCPLFLSRRGPLRAAYSPPLQGAVHHMGPVFVGYEGLAARKRSQLLQGFQAALDGFLTERARCNYVELRYSPGFVDARSLQWAGYAVSLLYTRLLDLRRGADALWSDVGSDLRRNVRRCRDRVVSREGSAEELEAFVRMVRDRYREVEVGYPLSESFVAEVFRTLGPRHVRLFLAEEAGELQTGLILALHRRRATVWHGSIRPKSSSLPVNDHLHWFAIQWALEHGLKEVEIMGADNRRLEEFKAKFNAPLVPCLHAQRSRSWVRLAERIGREEPSLF